MIVRITNRENPDQTASFKLSPYFSKDLRIYIADLVENISNSKCSKISNTRCLPKDVNNPIRLLLKKQSDQGLPCLLF